MRATHLSIPILNIILLVSISISVQGSIYNTHYAQALPISAEKPKVIMQQGTAGTSTIYTNNTSAKVSVAAPQENTTYDYVLKANNTATDSWKIRLKKNSDLNISRLQNCTIYFHNSTDGIAGQIYIENGNYKQDEGPWYNLPSLTTICITITVAANSTGTSYVYIYLEILVPNTSTYNLLMIAFEIT